MLGAHSEVKLSLTLYFPTYRSVFYTGGITQHQAILEFEAAESLLKVWRVLKQQSLNDQPTENND